MFTRAVNDISWSSESYSTGDLMAKYPAPLLVRVTQGHCGQEDTESVGQGQVIRIHRWLKQARVKAIDARGRHLSIPLDFDIPFEVIQDRKRTLSKRKTLHLADILRQFTLPRKVRFSASHVSEAEALEGGRLGVRMTLDPLQLTEIHEEVYMTGNAVNFGELDSSILCIPLHHDMEMALATGLRSGEKNWKRLMKELDNVVATRVRFAAAQGNQKIALDNRRTNGEASLKPTRLDLTVLQKRQQSLGRAFYYGTLQRKNKATGEEIKARPSRSVDMGSVLRKGRLFAKKTEPRRDRHGAVDNADVASISGTSTSAASGLSESTTDTVETTNSEMWFGGDPGRNGVDSDDDMVDAAGSEDDMDRVAMTPSLFGSVSRLSLFRPRLWDDWGGPGGKQADSDRAQGRRRRSGVGGRIHGGGGGRRLSTATSLSMSDIGTIVNSESAKKSHRPPSTSYGSRGRPDGRSLDGGGDGWNPDYETMEQTTQL